MEEVKENIKAKFEFFQKEYQECKEHISKYNEKTFSSIRRKYEKAKNVIDSLL